MTDILLGLGLVFVIEGLILALFPDIYERLAAMIGATPPETRRMAGLAAVTFGVALVWVSKSVG